MVNQFFNFLKYTKMTLELTEEQFLLIKESVQIYASHAYDEDMPYTNIEDEDELHNYCVEKHTELQLLLNELEA